MTAIGMMIAAISFLSAGSLSANAGQRRGPLAQVDVKNKFSEGDSLELMAPAGNMHFTQQGMESGEARQTEVASGNGRLIWLPLPEEVDLSWALLMLNLSGDTRQPGQRNLQKKFRQVINVRMRSQ